MVKIRLRGVQSAETETLWAKHIAEDLYELDNGPFVAYGVSWKDVVEARSAADGVLEFVRTVSKSGNRTIRAVFEREPLNSLHARSVLHEIKELGCSYEGMQPRLVSINIPPEIDFGKVVDFMSSEDGIRWEYVDPQYHEIDGRHQ